MGEVVAFGDFTPGTQPNTWILTPFSSDKPVLLSSNPSPAPAKPVITQVIASSSPIVTSPVPQTFTVASTSAPTPQPVVVQPPQPQPLFTLYPELLPVTSSSPQSFAVVSSVQTPTITTMAQPGIQTYSIMAPTSPPPVPPSQVRQLVLKQPANQKPPPSIVVRAPDATTLPKVTPAPPTAKLLEIKQPAPQINLPEGPFQFKLTDPIQLTGFPAPLPPPTGPQDVMLRFADPVNFTFNVPTPEPPVIPPPPPPPRPILLLAQYTCEQNPQLVSVINTEDGKPYALSEKQLLHLKALPHPNFGPPPPMGGALMIQNTMQ